LLVTLHGDLEKAQHFLLQCKTRAISDSSWRMSLAFIKAVKGDCLVALELYDSALSFGAEHQLLFDVEAYIEWWLTERKGPVFLYLLSALLNSEGKMDYSLALGDVNKFICQIDISHKNYEPLMARALKLKDGISATLVRAS